MADTTPLLYVSWAALELLALLMPRVSQTRLEFAASALAAMGPIRSHLNPAPASGARSLGTSGYV